MDKEDVVCIHIHTMEYYAAIKRNGILPYAIAQTDLEGTGPSEISQTDEDEYGMIPLICGIWRKENNMKTNS